MNKIDSYLKVDSERIISKKRNIEKLQDTGLYPKKFDFPLLLQLELTKNCNVYCKHCYNNSGRGSVDADAMTPEHWKDFCRYVVSKGGVFECVISGGEPLLLGENLFDIMDILHDDGSYFLLITNGFLLTQSVVNRLGKYRYKWIQVSIDGATAEYHDSFRQRIGSWERAVNGAFMVSAAGLPLTIAHSVSPYNLKDIDSMCDLAYSLGAGSIILGEISLSGRTYEHRDLLLTRDEREQLLEKVEYNYKRFQGKMLVQRAMGEELQYEQNASAPSGALIIRPDGSVRLDCMTPFIIGNVLEDDFQEIWNLKGVHCWDHPKVKAYYSGNTEEIRNHVDNDILLD